MGDLSPHFSRSEFRSKPGGELIHIDHALIETLERIRAIDGRPLRIVSGYRTPERNRAAGGAARSQHPQGRAADIEPGRCTPDQAWAAGAVGIGIKSGWVIHVDTRPGPRVFWHY